MIAGLPGPAIAVLVAGLYALASQYVIWLNDPVNAGAGYWPAAGLTVTALLLVPMRRWGWVVAAIATAEVVGSGAHGYPLAACLWWAAGNVVEPIAAVLMLRRLNGSGRLAPLAELRAFVIAAVIVGPMIGAALGSVGTSLEFGRAWGDVMVRWWIGDGLGVLVVAPFVLCLREPVGRHRSPFETLALAGTVVAIPVLAFRSWSPEWDIVLPYLVFPLMMWASVRFGIRGAATVGFAVAQVATIATALGYGPFHAAADTDDQRVAVLQVFLAAALTAGLTIATLVRDTMDRMRAFERQRSTTDALQDAVLPDRLPQVPGLEIAARYMSALNDSTTHIGGDWYDAFDLPSGATAFAVGDIAGHDLSAAVVMLQMRNGLRSLLIDREDTAGALAGLDRQLSLMRDAPIATGICARYEDRCLTWSNAGHPPLLLASADGSVRYLDEDPSPLLGVGLGSYVVNAVTLEVGDVVIGYTDGLIEHRTWTLQEAFSHLVHLVAASPLRDPDALCNLVLRSGLAGRSRDDDACVIAFRVVQ